mmetsp:Transcript_26286/g.74805  ORF Transcript_26286/g.74805 Transcript_26286/m.74805 type:complete len:270 (-) Transcript_26286:408-1217(-)
MAEPHQHHISRQLPPMADGVRISVVEDDGLPLDPHELLVRHRHAGAQGFGREHREVRGEPGAVAEVGLQVRAGVELHVVHVHEVALRDLGPRLDQLACPRRHHTEEVEPLVIAHDPHCLPTAGAREVLARCIGAAELRVEVPGVVEDRLQLRLEDGVHLLEPPPDADLARLPDGVRGNVGELDHVEADVDRRLPAVAERGVAWHLLDDVEQLHSPFGVGARESGIALRLAEPVVQEHRMHEADVARVVVPHRTISAARAGLQAKVEQLR